MVCYFTIVAILIIGHNKTKLFIYHGGNNGLYEAIYHGVPIIVMPILLDQFDVAQNVFEKEVGLKIMISELSSERVSQVIEEVLTNNKYVLYRKIPVGAHTYHLPRHQRQQLSCHKLILPYRVSS